MRKIRTIGALLCAVIALNAQTLQSPKVYGNLEQPDSMLAYWYTALANSQTSAARVLMIGDSIMSGTGATLTQQGWAYQLPNLMQPWYPMAGIGFVFFPGASNTPTACSYMRLGAFQPSQTLCSYTTTGTWTQISSMGTVSGSSGTPWQGGSSATITISNAYGTSVDLYFATSTDSGSGFTAAVDGGSATTVSNSNATSGSYTWVKTTVSLGSLGTHTVVLTAPASGNMYFLGFETGSSTTTGIRWVNMGLSGTSAAGWCGSSSATNTTTSLLGAISQMAAPSLIIEALGTNDYSSSPATWQSNLDNCLTALAGAFPNASVLLLDQQDQGTVGNAGASYRQAYYAATRVEAAKFGAGYLNIGDAWGTYSYAQNTLGIMQSGTNTLHPNTIGHYIEAQMVARRLFPWYFPQIAPATPLAVANHFSGTSKINNLTPAITLGAGAGTTATISSSNLSDATGDIKVSNTGTIGSASSAFLTITFGVPYASLPECSLYAESSQAATAIGSGQLYFDRQNSSASAIRISTGSAAPPISTFQWIGYTCTQVSN
jgi:lysophospholipase L1-like esterase